MEREIPSAGRPEGTTSWLDRLPGLGALLNVRRQHRRQEEIVEMLSDIYIPRQDESLNGPRRPQRFLRSIGGIGLSH